MPKMNASQSPKRSSGWVRLMPCPYAGNVVSTGGCRAGLARPPVAVPVWFPCPSPGCYDVRDGRAGGKAG